MNILDDDILNEFSWENHVAGGTFLDGVVSDSGEIYDFWNCSHHVQESANAFVYDLPWESSTDSVGVCFTTGILENGENSGIFSLNSNIIMDLDTGSPWNFNNAVDSLGTRIAHLTDPYSETFYTWSAYEIINRLDNGERIQFAVLFPMYYYNFEYPDLYWKSSPIFPPQRQGHNVPGLWEASVSNSTTKGRTWSPGQGYITDYPDYGPGHIAYVPDRFLHFPGLLYECCQTCHSQNSYTIKSLNQVDDIKEFVVTGSQLMYILSGYQYGLANLIGEEESENWPEHMIKALDTPYFYDGIESYWFGGIGPSNGRYQVFYGDDTKSLASDSKMMYAYLGRIEIVTIGGTTYDLSNQLGPDNEPIDAFKFPVFVKSIGQSESISRVPHTPSGCEDIWDLFDDTEFGSRISTDVIPLEILKEWDDNNCRAFRPDEVLFGLYYYTNNTYYFYDTVAMTEAEHRLDETHWKMTTYVPRYIVIDGSYTDISTSWKVWEWSPKIPEDLRQYTSFPYWSDPYDSSTSLYTPTSGYDGFHSVTSTPIGISASIFKNQLKSNWYNMIRYQEIPVRVHKVWQDKPCGICNQSISGTIGSNNFTLQNAGDVATINLYPNVITPDLSVTENVPNGFVYVISHSDDCLDWTIINKLDPTDPNTPVYTPLDPSGDGEIFYFEMDYTCYNWNEDESLIGFQVSNTSELPSDLELVYKIVYYNDNQMDPIYNPNTAEYTEFLHEGWRRYDNYSGQMQAIYGDYANIIQETGSDDFYHYLPQAHASVFFDNNMSKDKKKVRIYIGNQTEYRHTMIPGFKIRPIFASNYIVAGSWNKFPKKNYDLETRSTPIRCGGWLSSLYGISEQTLKSDVELYSTHPHWCWYPRETNGEYYWAIAHHQSKPPRWENENLLFPELLHYDPDAINDNNAFYGADILTIRDDADGYNPNIPPEYRRLSHNKGDLFQRMFYEMGCLVDASQLFIPKAYTEMQYYKTFQRTGLQFGEIGAKKSNTSEYTTYSTHFPYFHTPEEDSNNPWPYRVDGSFKDMYRECPYIEEITTGTLMLPDMASAWSENNTTDIAGKYMFDAMFRGDAALSTINTWLPVHLPKGCCKGMFYGCNNVLSCSGLFDITTSVGAHACRSMFSFANFQCGVPLDLNVSDADFCYAYMYYNNKSWWGVLLPATSVGWGSYWGMFGQSFLYSCDIEATSYKEFSFNKMFEYSIVDTIYVSFTKWNTFHDVFFLYKWVFDDWVCGINHVGDFYKPSSLLKKFGDNRIPKPPKWSVTNV